MLINTKHIRWLPSSTKHALDALEFDRVRGWLRERCASSLGKELVDSLAPTFDVDEINFSFDLISELKELLRKHSKPDLNGLQDIRKVCVLIAKEGVASAEEIWRIRKFANVVNELSEFSEKIEEDFPLFRKFCKKALTLPKVEHDIGSYLEEPGRIKYNATSLLEKLNDRHSQVHDQIHDKLNKIISSRSYNKFLQDDVITVREGRYVIPVKTSWKGKVEGIVHDRSASEQTVFIEPLEITELNNELKEIESDIEDEKERILRKLTDLISSRLNNIFWDIKRMAKLDFYRSAAIFSLYMKCTPPSINRENKLHIIKAYHPLLIEEERDEDDFKAYPINLHLDNDLDALILTGPNMGGKTVTLKTIGLLSAMALSGLHIPASPDTEIPFFKKIFVDIGDEQSIEFSLSSFAAHLERWKNALNSADNRSLVLLDELGSSTAPEEGAPLSISLLEHLAEKGCLTIAATHLGTLKAIAEKKDSFENASMEFDQETLQPTYSINMGNPGRSWAFEVAKKLGLPEELINQAYNYLSDEEVKLDNLTNKLQEHIESLKEQEREVERKLQQAEKKNRKLEEQQAEIKQEMEELQKLKHRYKVERDEMLEEFLQEKKENLEIGKNNETSSEDTQKEKVKNINNELTKVEERKTERTGEVTSQFSEGDQVFIITMNREGKVAESPDNKGRMTVLVNGKKISIHSSKVELTDKEKKRERDSKTSYDVRKPSKEIDVRGKTVNQAKRIIARRLDDAIATNMESLRVIHGEKKLSRELRNYFEDSSRVNAYRTGEPWEGANNVTVIKLKEGETT